MDLITYENPEKYYKDNILIYKSFCNYGVYRTFSREDNKACIMKITHEQLEESKDVARLKSEIFLLMRINSQYILKPKDIFYYNERLIIISEEMDHGSMENVI